MTKKYQVSIVAIFRNEHRYMEEWMSYHLKVGVDHFYLYDNGGDHEEILKPFEESITYILWTDDLAKDHFEGTGMSRQKMAYTHCFKGFAEETEWLQLLDLDEYLVPMDRADVKVSLKKYESPQIGKLRVPRFNFGNSGRWKKSTKGSLESFVRRERFSSHHKDMGRGEFIRKVRGPHSFRTRRDTIVPDNLRVYHHYIRSLGEWLERAKTGGGQAGRGFRVMLGKNRLLAYLTFFVLNLRSVYFLAILLGFNLIMWFVPTRPFLLLINLLIAGLGIHSFLKGQNEIKDRLLKELMDQNETSLITND